MLLSLGRDYQNVKRNNMKSKQSSQKIAKPKKVANKNMKSKKC